jgi:catechol 2,3-dioxygenase-like lactoylglutathione lyase family enzyme
MSPSLGGHLRVVDMDLEGCFMKFQRIDHVGINVKDIAAAKAFFLDLGFELMGEMDAQGELFDRVTGLKDVRDRIAMLRIPGAEANIELVQFYNPPPEGDIRDFPANGLGVSHISFAVEDIDGIVAQLVEKGTRTFSEVQNYEGIFKVLYVHGPEGIILELAEKIG